jgi:hypothetical protein
MIPLSPRPQFCTGSAAVLAMILDKLSREDEVVLNSFCIVRHYMLGCLMVFVTVQFLPVEKRQALVWYAKRQARLQLHHPESHLHLAFNLISLAVVLPCTLLLSASSNVRFRGPTDVKAFR